MRRSTRVRKLQSSDSEEDSYIKPKEVPSKKINENIDDSSSDSDIGDYLQSVDKLDLNSPFFNVEKKEETTSFDKIERAILGNSSRAIESDSESELEDSNEAQSQLDIQDIPSTSQMNFHQLEEYTRKIEEAKHHIEQYNARKKAESEKVDIFKMLISTEGKLEDKNDKMEEDFHSSDFESCSDSEKEGWEEVKNKEQVIEKAVPKEGVQITVEMPGVIRIKKKGIDLVAAMKRRLNRIRKENQVLVHKVHLLCWIAHGNYLNSVLNSEKVLSLALSLLPSEKSYPSDRVDLTYLEQILRWYKKAIQLSSKVPPWFKDMQDLCGLLQKQIEQKEVYNKNMLVYIFISILRALGIQCRLILSFQVEPVRPPASELCSISMKPENKTNKKAKSTKDSEKQIPKEKKVVEVNKKISVPTNKKTKKASKPPSQPKSNLKDSKEDNSKKSSRVQKTSKETAVKEDKYFKPKKLSTDIKSKRAGKENALENKSSKPNLKKIPQSKQAIRNNKSKEVNKPVSQPNLKKIDQPPPEPDSVKPDLKKLSQIKSPGISTTNGESVSSPKLKRLSLKKSVSETVKIAKLENGKSEEQNVIEKKRRGRPKSTSALEKPKKETQKRSKSNDKIKIKLPQIIKSTKSRLAVPQVDGAFDSNEEHDSITQIDGASDNLETPAKPNLKSLRSSNRKSLAIKSTKPVVKYKDTDSEEDFEDLNQSSSNKPNLKKLTTKSPEKSKFFGNDVRNDIIKIVKERIKEQKVIDEGKKVKIKRKKVKNEDEDSDYAPEVIKKKHHDSEDEFIPKVKVKQRVQVKRKVLSSDEEEEKSPKKKKQGVDIWAEVFLENEEKWLSVDVISGEIHCVQQLYNRATHPVSYVIAWNNDNSIKDITRRYCQNFNTVTRKLRIDLKWWQETLRPFLGTKTARDREEDDELERQQLEKPLPTSIAEYKNHPLYVLKRHLLKFEGIYPPDAPTLGFVRQEPVYSRHCVYTLHSRDIWLKHAKVVKPGEQPYKIVKARPKYDRLSNTFITDQLLEIFGPWQTEDYVPPTAENGIVPRNAYGNVELFKPSMLPKKTVHLQLPGLNKIAKRMNIDCASAVIGFDFHSGWSHPTYDGFVVCEEYEDQLIAAWELEQEEIARREEEKIEKRVYGNWKRLIRGLLIRERLKAKYDFGPLPDTNKEKCVCKKKKHCLIKKKQAEQSDSD